MKCPQCHTENQDDSRACSDCGCSLGKIKGAMTAGDDQTCQWDEYGMRCRLQASINGYCSDHYWFSVKGYRKPTSTAKPENYRQRWYRERKLEYKDAPLVNCPPFRRLGGK